MTAVNCDTSPIRALAWIDQLHLLPQLFGEVIVPPAVASELVAARREETRVVVQDYPFLCIESPENVAEVQHLLVELDRGEAEAIVLARERSALLIVDDAAARAEALRRQIAMMGTLRLLVLGKQKKTARGHRAADKSSADRTWFLH